VTLFVIKTLSKQGISGLCPWFCDDLSHGGELLRKAVEKLVRLLCKQIAGSVDQFERRVKRRRRRRGFREEEEEEEEKTQRKRKGR